MQLQSDYSEIIKYKHTCRMQMGKMLIVGDLSKGYMGVLCTIPAIFFVSLKLFSNKNFLN